MLSGAMIPCHSRPSCVEQSLIESAQHLSDALVFSLIVRSRGGHSQARSAKMQAAAEAQMAAIRAEVSALKGLLLKLLSPGGAAAPSASTSSLPGEGKVAVP